MFSEEIRSNLLKKKWRELESLKSEEEGCEKAFKKTEVGVDEGVGLAPWQICCSS